MIKALTQTGRDIGVGKMGLPSDVYTEKRGSGWVLIELTGLKRSSATQRIWPPSLEGPRKPRRFLTNAEARDWAIIQSQGKRPGKWWKPLLNEKQP